MKSIILIGLCALLPAVTSLRADDKNAIKGGVGIGPIRLKIDVAEAERILGDSPDLMILGRGARVWFVKSSAGKQEEIVVSIRRAENGHDYFVNEVAVTSPDYRTPKGNSTASDLAAIWKEFPDLTWVETGDSLDGATMELYSSKESGVSVMVEPPAGRPAADKPAAGVPTGKCRAFIVQAVGDAVYFVQLGVAPKKADAD